jgi:hypothetical protein
MQSSRLSRFFSQSKFDTFLRALGFDDFVGIGQTHPDKLASSFIVVYQQDRSYTFPAASTFSIVVTITTLAYCNRRTKRQIIDGASVKENNRRHIRRIRHIWRLAASSVGDQENLKRLLRRDSIPRSAALPVERLNYTLQPLPQRRPKTYAWAAFMLG